MAYVFCHRFRFVRKTKVRKICRVSHRCGNYLCFATRKSRAGRSLAPRRPANVRDARLRFRRLRPGLRIRPNAMIVNFFNSFAGLYFDFRNINSDIKRPCPKMPPPSRQDVDNVWYRLRYSSWPRISQAKKGPASKPKNLTYNKKMLYSHYQTYANRSRFVWYMVVYQHNSFRSVCLEGGIGHLCNLTYNKPF